MSASPDLIEERWGDMEAALDDAIARPLSPAQALGLLDRAAAWLAATRDALNDDIKREEAET